MTGSESQNLYDEINNQNDYKYNPKRHTFMIFARKSPDFVESDQYPDICKGKLLVGDVNLCFHEYLEEDEAEIGIMIAEVTERKKGLALEAV